MNRMRQLFLEETGSSWINSQGEPDLDYVEWLENKLESTAKEFCFQAEKLAFYDKCGQVYYDCKKITS